MKSVGKILARNLEAARLRHKTARRGVAHTANVCGIGIMTVHRIKRGDGRQVKLDTYIKISVGLGVPLPKLFKGL